MNSIIKFIITLIILAAAGDGGYFLYKKYFIHQTQAAAGPSEVNVVSVKTETINLTTPLPGRVSAYKIADIYPQVAGTIRKINFEEGSLVKKGQSLYQINPAVYQSAYDKALMALNAAASKKVRYEKLLKVDAVSQQDYQDVVAALASAQSDFNAAKMNLDYSKVAAPIEGYIGKSNFTEGAVVTPGQTQVLLTTITQLDPIYVDMVQPTKESIRLGDQKSIDVSLEVDKVRYEEKGELKFSEVFADQTTDSVRLRAKFSNKNQKLLPGMFVTAILHLKPITGILLSQKAATRASDGSLSVFVVENNVAKIRQIKAEQTLKDKWVVSEGLNDGDMVVIEGIQKIYDGSQVKIAAIPVKNETPTTDPQKSAPAANEKPATENPASTTPAKEEPKKEDVKSAAGIPAKEEVKKEESKKTEPAKTTKTDNKEKSDNKNLMQSKE